MAIQLDFFEHKTEQDFLRDEIELIRISHDKVRRRIFANHDELAKRYIELYQRLDLIERNISKK